MKNLLAVSTTVAALMLGATGAFALDEKNNLYVTGEGENRMVMGGDMKEGARVYSAENGAAPAECAEGAFYELDGRIMSCSDNTAFSLSEPAEGTMMSDGNPYPEGAMMMMQGDGAVEGSTGVTDTTGTDANSGTDGSAATSGN